MIQPLIAISIVIITLIIYLLNVETVLPTSSTRS